MDRIIEGTSHPSDGEKIKETVARLVVRHAGERGALLPLLHAIQSELGFVSDEAVAEVAHALNLSRADVHGVLTFYHDFHRRPPATHVVKVCRAEACQARGGAAIEQAAAHRLGVAVGHTRADRHVMLEPVYCLGLCATGPNMLVDGKPISRVDQGRLDRIVQEIAL